MCFGYRDRYVACPTAFYCAKELELLAMRNSDWKELDRQTWQLRTDEERLRLSQFQAFFGSIAPLLSYHSYIQICRLEKTDIIALWSLLGEACSLHIYRKCYDGVQSGVYFIQTRRC